MAVIDSGVNVNHPDLDANVWVNPDEIPGNNRDDDGNQLIDDTNGWDFANNDNTVYDPDPITGEGDEHGTHMAGIIAAEGNNGTGVAGVSWRTKIMPLKFIGTDGRGTVPNAIKALDYALSKGVKISNNSWGCNRPCKDSETLPMAIDRANASGHLYVAAAGNSFTPKDTDRTPFDPAGIDSPNVISVAATDNNDVLSDFSNYGATSVDLAAPGIDVYSTEPGGYGYRSGTSMATAYVSGVAALLKSKFPELGHLQIKERILQSAERKAGLVGTSVTEGRLNAADALGIETNEITLSSSRSEIVYGEGVSFSGGFTSSGQALAGKQVVLEKRSGNENRFSPFATVTTTADGSFSYGTSHPDKNTEYRARFGGDREARLGASVSPTSRVAVRVAVTLSVSTNNLRLGKARPISGYVKPNHSGATVTLTIKRGTDVLVQRFLTLNTDSRYYTTFKPKKTGSYSVVVRFDADGDHLGNTSPTKTFKVVN